MSSSLLSSLRRAPALSVAALGLLGASAFAAIPASRAGGPDIETDATGNVRAPDVSLSAPAPGTHRGAATAADAALVATATRSDLRPDPTSFVPAVLDAVTARGGVPLMDGSACSETDLQVAFTAPTGDFVEGAHVEPLGPVPADGVKYSAGVVQCAGSNHAYLGFEAVWEASAWDVSFVPDLGEDHDDEHLHDEEALPRPAPPSVPAGASGEQLEGRADAPPIEGYARYEPQSTCDPTAKEGALQLRSLLLARYPVSTSMGISRSCSVGGRSEHKEGRAFDWGVNVNDSAQRAAAEDFLEQLLATDQYGNQHAVARRMGVMYVIWDHQVWSSYRADAGWRAYSGASAHTDHVHISLSWAGALGSTSFWSGEVADGMSPVPSGGGTDGGTATSVDGSGDDHEHGRTSSDGGDDDGGRETSDDGRPVRDEDDAAEERREREREDQERERERERQERDRQERERQERERQEREREQQEREQERRERELERQEREREREERRAAREDGDSERGGPGGGRGKGRGGG